MIDMNKLCELSAALGSCQPPPMRPTSSRHGQHNKNADYWLARGPRFDHLRREHEHRSQRQNPEAG